MRPIRATSGTILIGLLLIGLLLIGACQGASSGPSTGAVASGSPIAGVSVASLPSASESRSLDPSPSATVVPSARASEGPAGLVAPGVTRTAAAGLRVRPKPDLSSAAADCCGTIPKDRLLFVADGPIVADGSDWYFVMPLDAGPTGWATAVDRTGTVWLEPASLACPTSPLDGTEVLDLGAFGGLVCFGNREVELVGDVLCQVADVDRPFVGPDWLSTDRLCTFDLGGQTLEIHDAGIAGLRYPTARRATVTGHFDDPQATTCRWTLDPPVPDPIGVVANCRAMFVGTAIRPAP